MTSRIAVTGAMAPTVAETQLRAGNLDQALEALFVQVRDAPRDAAARVFLFQLLAAAGQWARARVQLDVSQQLDPSNAILNAVYNDLLAAEMEREAVFSGKSPPKVLGGNTSWSVLLLQALRLDIQGWHEQAAQVRAQAFAEAPATSGSMDGRGREFDWLSDADPRFGPCLEMVVDGGYAWVPCTSLWSMELEAPSSFCDTLWLPARVTWKDGTKATAHLFARYPGSENSSDSALRLGRRTDWIEYGSGTWVGVGQRMLATDGGEWALLDVRNIEFNEG